MFFLVFMILQFFPNIRTVGPKNAVYPLLMVLGFGMLREFLENLKRYRADKETNERVFNKVVDKSLEKIATVLS